MSEYEDWRASNASSGSGGTGSEPDDGGHGDILGRQITQALLVSRSKYHLNDIVLEPELIAIIIGEKDEMVRSVLLAMLGSVLSEEVGCLYACMPFKHITDFPTFVHSPYHHVLLSGSSGCGKTTMLNQLRSKLTWTSFSLDWDDSAILFGNEYLHSGETRGCKTSEFLATRRTSLTCGVRSVLPTTYVPEVIGIITPGTGCMRRNIIEKLKWQESLEPNERVAPYLILKWIRMLDTDPIDWQRDTVKRMLSFTHAYEDCAIGAISEGTPLLWYLFGLHAPEMSDLQCLIRELPMEMHSADYIHNVLAQSYED